MKIDIATSKTWNSHGAGDERDFKSIGEGVIIEPGARVFLAQFIEIGDNVYIGHDSIIKGYYDNRFVIGNGTWIGPQCFMYASAGIEIGLHVGIGPKVVIVNSQHDIGDVSMPILHAPLKHAPVVIGDGVDIGCSAIILPGVTIGAGAQIGAGSVVTKDVAAYTIVAGTPARVLRERG
ncbi:MAG: acyltransferase [candidate division Zixibacteria bacterium]